MVQVEQISSEEQYKYFSLIQPNVIFNRFDIRYKSNFGLLRARTEEKDYYVEYYLHEDYCALGVYMMHLEKNVLDALISYVDENFKSASYIKVELSLNETPQSVQLQCFELNFPEDFEAYKQSLSKGVRYNWKRRMARLAEDFKPVYKHLKKEEITAELVDEFLCFKKQTYHMLPNQEKEDLLSDYWSLSDAFCIYIDGKLAALHWFSSIDPKVYYGQNTTYDPKYKKYGIGNIVFYYAIEELFKQGMRQLHMGNGYYKYKAECRSNQYTAWRGVFQIHHQLSLKQKLFSVQAVYDSRRTKKSKVYHILGLQFKRTIQKNCSTL